jgi:hypothetical protein
VAQDNATICIADLPKEKTRKEGKRSRSETQLKLCESLREERQQQRGEQGR